jgi:HAD superfamily hydrolase (TIGR01549 family)
MAYDAILFDMDGVLLTGYHTDRAIYRRATATALADFGHDSAGDDPPPALVDPDSVTDVRSVCDDLGVPAAPLWAYRERAATTIENESIAAGDRVAPPDADALDSLAETHELGIVSNNRQGTARFVTDYFEFPMAVVRGRFPTLTEYGNRKPDPTYLEWALDRLDGEDVLFVGDRRSDVEAAHRADIDAALLARSGDPPEGSPEPEHHIESLTELVGLR